MSKILYLHGFGSCGKSNKSMTLMEYFGEDKVISPNLPYEPEQAVDFASKLIQEEQVSLLIGSSLGGFYATQLAEKFQLPAVLLNPSVQPWRTLSPYVGWQERFCDGVAFEFKEVYLTQLEKLETMPKNSRYLLLLQSEDEVLDYRVAKERYQDHRVIVEYGGNHRFENIHEYLSMIESFMKS